MSTETNTNPQAPDSDNAGTPSQSDGNQPNFGDAISAEVLVQDGGIQDKYRNGMSTQSLQQADGDQTDDANQNPTGTLSQAEENQADDENQNDTVTPPKVEMEQSDSKGKLPATKSSKSKTSKQNKKTDQEQSASDSKSKTSANKSTDAEKTAGPNQQNKSNDKSATGSEKATTPTKRTRSTAKSQQVIVHQHVISLDDSVKRVLKNNGSSLTALADLAGIKIGQTGEAPTEQSAANDGAETAKPTQNSTVNQDSAAQGKAAEDDQNQPEKTPAAGESDTGGNAVSQVADDSASQAANGSMQNTDSGIGTPQQSKGQPLKYDNQPGILRRLLSLRFVLVYVLLLVIVLQNWSLWQEIPWDRAGKFFSGNPTVANSDFIPTFSGGGLNSGLNQDLQLPSGLIELAAAPDHAAANNPAAPFANEFGLPVAGDSQPVQSLTDILSNEVKLDSDLLAKIEHSLTAPASHVVEPSPTQSLEFGTVSPLDAGDFSRKNLEPDNSLNNPPFSGPPHDELTVGMPIATGPDAKDASSGRYFADMPSPNQGVSMNHLSENHPPDNGAEDFLSDICMGYPVTFRTDSLAGNCQRTDFGESLVAGAAADLHATMQENLELLATDLDARDSYDENAVQAFLWVAAREFAQLALDDATGQTEFADGESIVRHFAGKFNEVAGSLNRQFGLHAAADGSSGDDANSVFLKKSWNILDGTVLAGISHDGMTATLKLEEHYVNVSEGDAVPNAGRVVEIIENGDYWEVRTSTGSVFSSKPSE